MGIESARVLECGLRSLYIFDGLGASIGFRQAPMLQPSTPFDPQLQHCSEHAKANNGGAKLVLRL